MYESYWQLREKAFENGSDSRFYFPGASHQAALLKLRYAVESRHSAALLAGPSGVGKTMIADVLRSNLQAPFEPVIHLVFPQMSPADLLSYLALELGAISGDSPEMSIPATVRAVSGFLHENTAGGRHAVVILDEAHLIEDLKTWESLRLLLNFREDGHGPMTLVLLGQPGVLSFFDRHPHWEGLLGVKCLLRSLDPAECRQYVSHRLKAAGCERSPFDDEAFEVIHELTQGIPRRINRLCDLALLIGYAEQQNVLTAEHIRAVDEELTTVAAD